MTTASGSANTAQEGTPTSLLTLVKYLELSLDEGKCVVMMRRDADAVSVYVGDPQDEDNDLKSRGTIAAAMVNEILELTRSGANQLSVGGDSYRFFRSFTQIADVGAVVFAPA